ncbi:TauD/TfdA family dioxygenase [Marinomonas sp. 2405UD68-3]|uniref:TauD/TfdA family dioxygenase n=1 Tax=Marinomonas sp. 2405UD68-3 TaxID=3391835 RepID=UPI0039C94903
MFLLFIALKGALILKNNYPHHYKTLTEQQIGFRLFSKTHDTRSIKPVIEILGDGTIGIIRYANWTINHTIGIDNEGLKACFSALACFGNILNKIKIELKLMPSELLLVNNHRITHGRKSFDLTSGNRHFQQVYLEIDDIEAKWRSL